MSNEQFNAFAAAVDANRILQDRLAGAARDYADTVVAIAAKTGFRITADQLRAAQIANIPEAMAMGTEDNA